MKLYTSYFANPYLKHVSPNTCLISITRFPPKNWTGPQFQTLAPSPELLKHVKSTHDHEYYTQVFNSQLSILDHQMILDQIGSISNNSQIVILLCYETPQDFCHRHLVSQWLNSNGITCEEYPSPHSQEPSLF